LVRSTWDFLRFTCAAGRQHWITTDALGMGPLTGYYAPMCGATVLPASLTVAPGRWCSRCQNSPLLT
jgi:hypothetical protein